MSIEVEGGTSLIQGADVALEPGIGTLTLGGYVAEIAARFGTAEAATICLDGVTERWSYADLQARSLEVARALIACGVGKETRVGILATNRLEFLSCLFGTALAGGVATTISTFFTGTELEEVLRLAGCSVLLLERRVLRKDFAEILAGVEPQLREAEPGRLMSLAFPFLRHLAFIGDDAAFGAIEGWRSFLARADGVAPAIAEARAASVAPSDPALLFFSSGSTGKAKGILSSHRAVCLQLWRWRTWYAIEEPPRTWSANGFFFSGNFSMALGGTLSSGGTLLLQRWFDPEEALALWQRERATMLLAWPHQWPQIVAAPGYADADLSALRYVDRQSPLAAHPTVTAAWDEPTQAYGNTETFTLSSVFGSGTPASEAGKSHGRPTAGTRIKIVDPITGAIVPVGARGEIAVKGPTLMMGYVGIPRDETLDDEDYLRTGDGGYVDEAGRLFWEGRLSDIIKTGGANVSPLEIDAVLRACPGVRLAQTVGVPDDLLGEIVVSCIVPQAGVTLTEEAVKAHARQHLASFKMPRRILFLAEAEFAVTGSAKLKASETRALAARRLALETERA